MDWFGSLDENLAKCFKSIGEWFASVIEAVAQLPAKIAELVIDGLKWLFIPDEDFINSKIEYLKKAFNRLGVATYDMSAIMGKETVFSDITCTIFGQEVVIVRMDIVENAVLKFRAVIRGFMTLMLVIYNYNQFMGLIGQQQLTLGFQTIGILRGMKEDEK